MDPSHLINKFLDQNKDHIWIVDRDYKLVYANKNWLGVVKAVTGVEKQLHESAFEDGFGEGYNEKWKVYYTRALDGDFFEIEEHYADPNSNKIHY